jgi:predicted nucleic acid-binding Zn ribbon protein
MPVTKQKFGRGRKAPRVIQQRFIDQGIYAVKECVVCGRRFASRGDLDREFVTCSEKCAGALRNDWETRKRRYYQE